VPGPLYVYAIAGERVPLDDLVGIRGERLSIVSIGACHVIAGESAASVEAHGTTASTESTESAPRGDGAAVDANVGAGAGAEPAAPAMPGGVTADILRAQDALVRALAQRAEALLPARFGSMFTSETALREVIAGLDPRLEEALERVRGCEQMTIRVFSSTDAPLVSMGSKRAALDTPPSEAASVPPASASTASTASASTASSATASSATVSVATESSATPGTDYLLRRAALLNVLPPALDHLRARLAAWGSPPFVRDERVERGRTTMMSTIHHLIPRGAADDYRAIVEDEAQGSGSAIGAAGLRLRVSGPSPAYAFADLGLGLS
jgi:hypothetical protein